MLRRIILPLLAFAGIGFGIFMLYYGAKKPPVERVLFPPPVSPYKHYIAGEGIVESAFKNITIGASFNELVEDVYVWVGQWVKKGAPLFKQDTRRFKALLMQALQELRVAKIDYENQIHQFYFFERLRDRSAVSEQAFTSAFYAKKLAQKRYEAVSKAVRIIKTDIERSTVVSPVDGEVLQLNIRKGQFANQNPFNQQSLVLFGDTRVYHLRVDVDEEDAWRIIKGAPATAFVRGNAKIVIPLTFVYVEPYMVPKVSLSGSNEGRIDTRVLQIVYKFPRNKYPVYVGQQLDVYLKAQPSGVAT